MRFDGKVAIVTGGAGGMGRATALAFADEGASVVVGDVDVAAGEALAQAAASAGKRLVFQRCDMAIEADVAALVATAERVFGRLDTIFNNAGIEQPVTPSTDVTEELFDRVIGINLKGVFFGCKHAIPALLRAGGGTIVNNSSVSAFANVGGNISYAASKGAVMSMTRVLAIEYASRNIRVNAINPGVIDTEMNRRNKDRAEDPAAVEERWMAVTPLGRMGTGEEIAHAVLFLASAQSSLYHRRRFAHRWRQGRHMTGRLAGKVAVVTGAARGIGRAVAHGLRRAGGGGLRVGSAGGRSGRARIPWDAAAADGCDRCAGCGRDLRRHRSAEAQHVDVLVNNAGIIFYNPIEDIAVADWDRPDGRQSAWTVLMHAGCGRRHEAAQRPDRSSMCRAMPACAAATTRAPIAPRNSASRDCPARWR